MANSVIGNVAQSMWQNFIRFSTMRFLIIVYNIGRRLKRSLFLRRGSGASG